MLLLESHCSKFCSSFEGYRQEWISGISSQLWLDSCAKLLHGLEFLSLQPIRPILFGSKLPLQHSLQHSLQHISNSSYSFLKEKKEKKTVSLRPIMRLHTPLLLVLPILAAAQVQKPLGENLQGWFDKVKSFFPTAATHPIASSAAKVAAKNITPLTKENWHIELSPSSLRTTQGEGPETWMVLISGSNKTCFGQCGRLETAWNETAVLLAADPSAPKLGYINCDTSPVLCAIWAAAPPAIWHIQLPIINENEQSSATTTVRILKLNTTATTAKDMVNIHAMQAYQKTPPYEGAFQPFNGWLAKTGLAMPLGYLLYGFSMIPSWAFMIVISIVSRNIM